MRLFLALLLASALSGTGIAQTAPDANITFTAPTLSFLTPDPVLAVVGFNWSVAFWMNGDATVVGDERDVVSNFWPVISSQPYQFDACQSASDIAASSQFSVTHSYALVASGTDTNHEERSWSVSIGVDEFEIVGPVSLDARRLWSKLANELTRRCRLRKALETVPHA